MGVVTPLTKRALNLSTSRVDGGVFDCECMLQISSNKSDRGFELSRYTVPFQLVADQQST